MQAGVEQGALARTLEARPEFSEFEPFTVAHAVTLGVCLVVIAVVVLAGRALRTTAESGVPFGSGRGGLLVDSPGRMLGVLGLGVWLAVQFYWVRRAVAEGPEQLAQSLPLHVCDLAMLIGALALMTGSRFWTVILYFWGIGLSTQAFITPVVRAGPLFTEFWIFWESHTLIVGSAVYVVAVRGYRPTLRDAVMAFGFTAAYTAMIMPLNLMMGWNYGYVGNATPGAPTVIDRLGPWPLRLVPLGLIVAVIYAIAWAPWAWMRRGSESREGRVNEAQG